MGGREGGGYMYIYIHTEREREGERERERERENERERHRGLAWAGEPAASAPRTPSFASPCFRVEGSGCISVWLWH